MPVSRRLKIAGLAVAVAYWALAGGALVVGAPRLTLWLGISGALSLALAALTVRAIDRPRPDGGGPGGGEPPEDPEPPWWPEFDRAFRAHVALRDRESV